MEAHALTRPDQTFGGSFPEYFGAETAQLGYYPGWDSLDPNLEAMRHNHIHYGLNLEQNDHFHHRYFCSYDGAAHGFAPDSTVKQTETQLYQLGLSTQWHGDYDRRARYLSPTSSGASLSSSDSSMSDYPLSPDASKDTRYLAASQNVYPSPVSDAYRDPTTPMYYPGPIHTFGFATPVLPSQTSLSMKDLQFSPDLHAGDDFVEEADTIVASAHVPEVLELSEHPIPEQRTLDADQESQSDEDESMKDESDNDADFTPARASRQPAIIPRRLYQRAHRRTASALHTVQDPAVRIQKPARKLKAKAKISRKASLPVNGTTTATGSKQFPCPFAAFGCPAIFPSKNEWKRHTASQHLQLGFYRCDLGACSPDHPSQLTQTRGHNDFNRKDLFTQHCRRMHWDECDGLKVKGKDWAQWSTKEKQKFEVYMEDVRDRCWMERRKAPKKSGCGIGMCQKVFDDDRNDEEGKAWEERMEHVGRHHERGEQDDSGEADEGLKEWCVANGLVVDVEGVCYLKGCEPEESRPSMVGPGRRGVRRGLRRQQGSNGRAEDEEEDVSVEQQAQSEREEDDTDAEGEDDE